MYELCYGITLVINPPLQERLIINDAFCLVMTLVPCMKTEFSIACNIYIYSSSSIFSSYLVPFNSTLI